MDKQKDDDNNRNEKTKKVGRGGCIFFDYRIKYMDSTEFWNFIHTKFLSTEADSAILCLSQISIRKELVVEVNSRHPPQLRGHSENVK